MIQREIRADYKVQQNECEGHYRQQRSMTTLDLAQLHCVTVCVEAYTYLCYTDGSLSSSVHCDSSCPAVWSTHRCGGYRYNVLVNMHCISILPFHATLAGAQEVIRNLQTRKNSTHITFSWDIVDGYYSSSYINSFRIYYRQRPYSSYYSYKSVSYSNSNLIKIGSSFQYTTTVTSFSTFGQYVMWVYVSRSGITPSTSYSDQIYVEVGK